jgi:hypothetical protein
LARDVDVVRAFIEGTQIPFLRSLVRNVLAADDRLSVVGRGGAHFGIENACGQFESASDTAQKPVVTLPSVHFNVRWKSVLGTRNDGRFEGG